MRKTLKVLPFVLASGVLYASQDASAGVFAGECAVAVGYGRRPLDNVEQGLEDYLSDMGYTNQFPDFPETFDLNDTTSYFIGQFSFATLNAHLFKGDSTTFLGEINFTSSALSTLPEDGEDSFPLYYEEIDLGDMDIGWEVTLPLYGSAAVGLQYSPGIFRSSGHPFHLAPQATVTGGYSYLIANGQIDMTYVPSELMQSAIDYYGQDWFDENVGMPSHKTISASLNGHGPFAHPRLGVEIGFGLFNLLIQGGFRFEKSFVEVRERAHGTLSYKGETDLNLSGFTKEILFEYNF